MSGAMHQNKMMELKAKIRDKFGRKTNSLRKQGVLPAVLYGEGVKNLSLGVAEKEFEKIYQEAGESSLVTLEVDTKPAKKIQVLIHDTARDPLTGRFLHVDFYHPSAQKEIEAEIPLVFEGTSLAVKELGGTLVREIQQVEVKGLAQKLPREIKISIEKLKTFEDRIVIGDLSVPEGVTILRDKEEIVALVVPPREEEEEAVAEEEKVEEEKTEGGEPASAKAAAGREVATEEKTEEGKEKKGGTKEKSK